MRTTLANFKKQIAQKKNLSQVYPVNTQSEMKTTFLGRLGLILLFKWSNRYLAHNYNSNRKKVSVSRETIRRILLRKGMAPMLL